MLEQIVTWTGIALIIVWVIATFATQIMYLIASFRASVGLTLLSFIIPFLGLYVLIKFWEDLKRPFMNQLVVAFGGFAVILGGGMALQAMGLIPSVPTITAAIPKDNGPPVDSSLSGSASTQEIQELPPQGGVPGVTPVTTTTPQPTPVEPTPVEPTPGPPASTSRGTAIAIRHGTTVTIPNHWNVIRWTLPNLVMAMGDKDRGEYVTVQILEKDADRSFTDYQQAALQVVLGEIIEGSPPTQSRSQTIDGCEAITFAMGGRCRLPDLTGHPMSARISCIDGQDHRYCIVQWRTAAWDTQTVQTFDSLLESFVEKEP
jgi:hypothetical protein